MESVLFKGMDAWECENMGSWQESCCFWFLLDVGPNPNIAIEMELRLFRTVIDEMLQRLKGLEIDGIEEKEDQ